MNAIPYLRRPSSAVAIAATLALVATGSRADARDAPTAAPGAAGSPPTSAAATAVAPATAVLVRRFVEEAWNAGNYAVVAQIFADDYVVRSLNATTPPVGRQSHAELVEHVRQFRDAFPDLVMTVEDVLESGDRAYVRTRLRGTHRGPLFGIPPSGRPVDFVLMGAYRSRDGKLVGHDVLVDFMGLMQQIGALPVPPGPPPAAPPGDRTPAAAAPTTRLRLLEPGAEGVTIDGADWWAPELGQPVQFDANTQLTDGATIRIRAVLESTNVTA